MNNEGVAISNAIGIMILMVFIVGCLFTLEGKIDAKLKRLKEELMVPTPTLAPTPEPTIFYYYTPKIPTEKWENVPQRSDAYNHSA